MKKASAHLRWINQNIGGQTTLGALVAKMQHLGFGLLIFIFSVPFIQPVPTGGLSSALGALIALLGVQLSMHKKSVWLPDWIQKTKLEPKTAKFLIGSAEKFFSFVERFIHPRLRIFCKSERIIGIMIAFMAVLLMLPIPLPLSNSLCAIPIALWAISIIEEDGLMSALAFLVAVVCVLFHTAVFYVLIFFGIEALPKLWDYIV